MVGMKVGLNRERLKHEHWALPFLPYLGFNQPKSLPSQQDFSLPKELRENRGRASVRSSTIAEKQHDKVKGKKISRAHCSRKAFLLDRDQIPAAPLKKEVMANVARVMGHETSNKNILEFPFYVLGV